jgi:hypothetical protein
VAHEFATLPVSVPEIWISCMPNKMDDSVRRWQ